MVIRGRKWTEGGSVRSVRSLYLEPSNWDGCPSLFFINAALFVQHNGDLFRSSRAFIYLFISFSPSSILDDG